jgi:hypothetical protein
MQLMFALKPGEMLQRFFGRYFRILTARAPAGKTVAGRS